MRFLHYVAFRATDEQRAILEALGVKTHDCPNTSLPGDPSPPLIKLTADEANPNWPLVHRFLIDWDAAPILAYTEFSPRELDAARWLKMSAWENGYALPQEDFKFFEVTFDLTHACRLCRVGKIQNAPFRIKQEPKWGRRAIMSLNQANDELFVPPAVWQTIFKPFGITCQPVANRHGKLLETVVQLVIEEKIDLLTDVLTVREICDTCGRPKYAYPRRGRFPALAREPSRAIAKTRQTFQDGLDMVDVIISQELRRAMIAHKLRGAEFTPVESHLDAFEA